MRVSEGSEHEVGIAPKLGSEPSLWRKLSEHRIAQWSAAYLGIAYAIQHAVVLTGEAFEWPQLVQRATMLLLILGAPVVVTLAWYHGERANRTFSRAEFSILSVLLVGLAILFYVFVRPEERVTKPAAHEASVTAARTAAADPHGAVSVVVLPFVNLSSDKEQEFFSDGMTEEITAALAKVPDLKVVARTSAFEFKGRNVDVQQIGAQLHATHLIEGSVRKAGDKLRITAQLIKTDDGTHLWAEDYDRDLTDVFAIQDDIAKSIATSLQVPLGLKQGETLVRNRTKENATYEDFLRAKALFRSRGYTRLEEASKLLDQVVAREPDFAPGWALLGITDAQLPTYHPAYLSGAVDEARPIIETYLTKAEAAAQRAVQLDPANPQGYLVQGFVQFARGNAAIAMRLQSHAMALAPDDPDVLHYYSGLLANFGYVKKALPIRRQLQALEPFVPVFSGVTSAILLADGQDEAAIAAVQGIAVSRVASFLAPSLVARGLNREAADALAATPDGVYFPATLASAIRVLRAPPGQDRGRNLPPLGALGFAVYPYVGAADRVMDYMEAAHNAHDEFAVMFNLWAHPYDALRKTERFKSYVRAAGLVNVWRKEGWPDKCHPTTGDDFECN